MATGVVVDDRVVGLVRLLEQVAAQRGVRLLGVPGAAAGRAQPVHDGDDVEQPGAGRLRARRTTTRRRARRSAARQDDASRAAPPRREVGHVGDVQPSARSAAAVPRHRAGRPAGGPGERPPGGGAQQAGQPGADDDGEREGHRRQSRGPRPRRGVAGAVARLVEELDHAAAAGDDRVLVRTPKRGLTVTSRSSRTSSTSASTGLGGLGRGLLLELGRTSSKLGSSAGDEADDDAAGLRAGGDEAGAGRAAASGLDQRRRELVGGDRASTAGSVYCAGVLLGERRIAGRVAVSGASTGVGGRPGRAR